MMKTAPEKRTANVKDTGTASTLTGETCDSSLTPRVADGGGLDFLGAPCATLGNCGKPRKPCEPEPWAEMATVKDDECDGDDCVAGMFGLSGRTLCLSVPGRKQETQGFCNGALGVEKQTHGFQTCTTMIHACALGFICVQGALYICGPGRSGLTIHASPRN